MLLVYICSNCGKENKISTNFLNEYNGHCFECGAELNDKDKKNKRR